MIRNNPKACLAATGAALMLLLSACESSGTSRLAGIGAPGGDGGSGNGGTGGDGSGGTGGTGGTGGDGGTGGTGGTGGNGGPGGTGGNGANGGLGMVTDQLQPVLATAGNAVLGVSDAQSQLTSPIASAIPVAAPLTGTITKVLNDTGTALVDVGDGRVLLVDGVKGVVGDVLTLNLGNQPITTAAGGGQGALGVGLLSSDQPTGTIGTVGVLTAGNAVKAVVNGVANVTVANVTAPGGGIANNLLNVSLAGNNLVGNGGPAAINANVLPSGLSAVPGGSGGITSVVNNVPVVGGVVAPVVSTVTNVASNVPVVGSVISTTAGVTSGGSGVGGALAPVTSTVQNVAANLPVVGNVVSGTTGGGAPAGGLLAPVTSVVGGVVSGLTNGAASGQTNANNGLLGVLKR